MNNKLTDIENVTIETLNLSRLFVNSTFIYVCRAKNSISILT